VFRVYITNKVKISWVGTDTITKVVQV